MTEHVNKTNNTGILLHSGVADADTNLKRTWISCMRRVYELYRLVSYSFVTKKIILNILVK